MDSKSATKHSYLQWHLNFAALLVFHLEFPGKNVRDVKKYFKTLALAFASSGRTKTQFELHPEAYLIISVSTNRSNRVGVSGPLGLPLTTFHLILSSTIDIDATCTHC